MKTMLMVMLLLALAGCGGGDPEPESGTQPVKCEQSAVSCR